MADPVSVQNPTDSDQQSGQSSSGKSGGKQPMVLPLIYIGRKFRGGIFIERVVIGGKNIDASQKQVKIKSDDRVEIFGRNLNNYDSIVLRIGSQPYTPHNVGIIPNVIRFTVPNYEMMLSGGGVIRAELISFFHPEFSCKLDNRLVYRTKEQREEDEKAAKEGKQAKGGEEAAGVGPAILGPSAFVEAAGEVMGGIAKAVVGDKTRAPKPQPAAGAATGTQSARPAKEQTIAEEEYDDGEAEEEYLKTEEGLKPAILPETLQQANELLGEHLDKNPELIAVVKDRQAILGALATGNFGTLSQDQKVTLESVVNKKSSVYQSGSVQLKSAMDTVAGAVSKVSARGTVSAGVSGTVTGKETLGASGTATARVGGTVSGTISGTTQVGGGRAVSGGAVAAAQGQTATVTGVTGQAAASAAGQTTAKITANVGGNTGSFEVGLEGNLSLKQSREIVGEHLDKNPQLFSDSQTKEAALKFLSTGQVSGLNSSQRASLQAILQQEQKAGGQVAAAMKNVGGLLGGAEKQIAGTLKQGMDIAGEHLDKNSGVMASQDREAVLQALASGNLESLTPQQRGAFRQYLDGQMADPQVQKNPRLLQAFSNLKLTLDGKEPEVQIQETVAAKEAPSGEAAATPQVQAPKPQPKAEVEAKTEIKEKIEEKIQAPPDIQAKIDALKKGKGLPPVLGAKEAKVRQAEEIMAGLKAESGLRAMDSAGPASANEPSASPEEAPPGTPQKTPSAPSEPAEKGLPGAPPEAREPGAREEGKPEGPMPQRPMPEERAGGAPLPGPGAGAPTGGGEGGGEGGEGTDRQMGAGYQRLISQEESDKKLDKRIKEAVKIVNKPLNKLLTQAALGVWEASIPSVGVSILLGAIVGDFLWAFKKQLVKRFLKLVPGWSSGKEIPTYNEAEKAQGFQNIKEQPLSQMISVDKIAEQVKISGTVKLHIIAMNLIVISVPLLVVFFILMVAVIGCNYPPNPSPSVLRALGYGEYCDAIKTAGQNQNFSGFGGGTSGGGGASGSW